MTEGTKLNQLIHSDSDIIDTRDETIRNVGVNMSAFSIETNDFLNLLNFELYRRLFS